MKVLVFFILFLGLHSPLLTFACEGPDCPDPEVQPLVFDTRAELSTKCPNSGTKYLPGMLVGGSVDNYVCENGKAIPEHDYQTDARLRGLEEAALPDNPCQQGYQKVAKACNTEGDNGLIEGAQGLASFASLAVSSSGSDAACSGLGRALAFMNGALGAFELNCSASTGDCEDLCKKEAEAKKLEADNFRASGQPHLAIRPTAMRQDAERKLRICIGEKKKWVNAIANVAQLGLLMGGTKKCGKTVETGLNELCQKNPSFPACQNIKPTDCSDPQTAQTNTICICQAAPKDPRCGYQGEAGTTVQSSSSDDGGGSGAGGIPNLSGFTGTEGDGSGAGDVQLGERKGLNSQDLAAKGGGGGGGGISGGGTGSSNGGGGGGGGAYGGDSNILKGYYGGGRGAGQVGGPSGRGDPRDPQAQGGGGRPGENMDLRRFLPGGKMDPRRGLAGITGPDGITGPNTDIWRKVKIRYNNVSQTLMP